MKNLTLRIDEKTLAAARKVAALRGTTVAKLVREFLDRLVAESNGEEREAQRKVRTELVDLAKKSSATPVDWKWNRDEIYEERLARFRAGSGFAEAARGEELAAGAPRSADELFRELTTETGRPPDPGHDEWFRRQVQETLDKKKAGKLKYKSLADVAARFGFNAR
jgi:hypothetical protein